MTFYKGDLVKLDETMCGSARILGRRSPTAEELESWYASPASRGLDSAGETKLAPRSVSVELSLDEVYTVVRGRARMSCVWGNPVKGYTLIELADGQRVFVKQTLLRDA